ncbi:rod shape-determining protein [Nonomuraea sp. NPDC059194]|uniref:rod shape-determining protein n=1 Tax=Nonomuraea sp. NPDC059194 TaxID=3346764 RepID=UPI00368F4C38
MSVRRLESMLPFLSRDLAIDLGTAGTRIHVRGRGIMLNEPSLVAVDPDTGQIVAFGAEATKTTGMVTVRPVRNGVIVEPDAARRMLRHFVHKVHGHPFARPRMTIAVPGGITSIERKVALEAAYEAQARQITFMEQPLAAALGAGLELADPIAAIVVDVGRGTTDVAAVSMGRAVAVRSMRTGGEAMDSAIKLEVRRAYGVVIDDRTAESLKQQLGVACEPLAGCRMEVSGAHPRHGAPMYATVSAECVYEAIDPAVRAIVEAVREVIESCSPEIAADVARRGLLLTGGGARLSGLPRRLRRDLGIPVARVDTPEHTVALGLGLWAARN